MLLATLLTLAPLGAVPSAAATVELPIAPRVEETRPLPPDAVSTPEADDDDDTAGDGSAATEAESAELGPITDLLAFDVSVVADGYDIPLEMQPLVAQYIQFFQGPGRRWFRMWMSRSTRYLPVMQPILESVGVPRDTVYLAMIESGFSTQAYSWAHAAGPWQFIPGT